MLNNLYLDNADDVQNMDFNSIDITDRYMFAYVMRNAEICRELLQYIFPEHTVQKVEYVPIAEIHSQDEPVIEKTLTAAFGKHGVRLDVYLDGGSQIYNVEMQTTSQEALAKRALYYTSEINVNQLPRGGKYDRLRPSYVIFICKFDPFDKELYRYSFRYTCEETSHELNDGSHIVFLNTKGSRGNITDGMREILKYMDDADDYPVDETTLDLIKKIDRAVIEARADDDWRIAYMTYQIVQRDAELRGEKRGEHRGKILGAIETYRELGLPDNQIKDNLIKRFNLSLAEASDFMVRPVQ